MKINCLSLVLFCLAITLFLPKNSFAQQHLKIASLDKYGFIFDDFGTSIVSTRDGGYLMAGYTADEGRADSHGSIDVLLIKIDKNGRQQWDKAYGGRGEDAMHGKRSLVESPDGGFIVCATTTSHEGQVLDSHDSSTNGSDTWVFKVNNVGSLVWSKCIGGTSIDAGFGLQVVSDSALLVVGYTTSNDGDVSGIHGAPVNNGNSYYADIFVAKMDLDGNLKWLKTYGGSRADFPISIEKVNDGNFIVVGQTQSTDEDITAKKSTGSDKDVWLLKINGNGNKIWDKSIGGSGNDIECSLIQKPNDPNFSLAMTNASLDGDFLGTTRLYDFNLLKMDSSGNVTWKKSYGGSAAESVTDIGIMSDGSYLICGGTYSDDGDVGFHNGLFGYTDAWVIDVDDTGKLLYTKEIGGSGVDVVSRLLTTADTGGVMLGFSNSTDGDLSGLGGGGDYNFWFVKVVKPKTTSVTLENLTSKRFVLYPSLVYELLKVKSPSESDLYELSVCDMAGNNILLLKNQSNISSVDVSPLCPGQYTLTIKSKGNLQVEKFTKL